MTDCDTSLLWCTNPWDWNGNANFRWAVDGTSSRIQMGIARRRSQVNSDDLDRDVNGDTAFHELTRGLSDRLVGDPTTSLCLPWRPYEQGGSMGEGWFHTIGTGVSGVSWQDLLTNIANETDGENHFTSAPDLDLFCFYEEGLVTALAGDTLELVKYKTGVMKKGQKRTTERFTINTFAKRASFILSWRNPSGRTALNIKLISLTVRVTEGNTVVHILTKVEAQVARYSGIVQRGGTNSGGARSRRKIQA